MLACLNQFSYATARGGVGWSMSDLYTSIATDAGSGSATLGEISTALLNLGLTVEAARSALTTVAQNVGSNPQQLAAINAELNYLNTYGATPPRNTWIMPVVIVGALVWLAAMSDKK